VPALFRALLDAFYVSVHEFQHCIMGRKNKLTVRKPANYLLNTPRRPTTTRSHPEVNDPQPSTSHAAHQLESALTSSPQPSTSHASHLLQSALTSNPQPSTSHAGDHLESALHDPPAHNLIPTPAASDPMGPLPNQPSKRRCTVQPTRVSTRISNRPTVVYTSQVPTISQPDVRPVSVDDPIDLAIQHRQQSDRLPKTYCEARKVNSDQPGHSNLGEMDTLCIHCMALLFHYEVKDGSSSVCCHKGKIANDFVTSNIVCTEVL